MEEKELRNKYEKFNTNIIIWQCVLYNIKLENYFEQEFDNHSPIKIAMLTNVLSQGVLTVGNGKDMKKIDKIIIENSKIMTLANLKINLFAYYKKKSINYDDVPFDLTEEEKVVLELLKKLPEEEIFKRGYYI